MRIYKVISTFPSNESAKSIVTDLVKQKLIACGNIIPVVESFYLWDGKLCEEQEAMVLLKTHDGKMNELKKALTKMHPYNVPEIIATEITEGSADYLNWVREL